MDFNGLIEKIKSDIRSQEYEVKHEEIVLQQLQSILSTLESQNDEILCLLYLVSQNKGPLYDLLLTVPRYNRFLRDVELWDKSGSSIETLIGNHTPETIQRNLDNFENKEEFIIKVKEKYPDFDFDNYPWPDNIEINKNFKDMYFVGTKNTFAELYPQLGIKVLKEKK